MKITIIASFFTKRDMKIYSRQVCKVNVDRFRFEKDLMVIQLKVIFTNLRQNDFNSFEIFKSIMDG
jgi:hypothetical protein